LIELDHHGALASFDLKGIEILDGGGHHRGDVRAGACHGIAALGLTGELAQDIRLQAAEHGLAAAIHHPPAWKIRVWNVISILGSHTDGEDIHAGLARLVDEVIELGVVFFPIAQDDERVVFLAGFLEGLDGKVDRRSNVGATAGGPGFIDLLDGLACGLVIDGERRIDISTAGEADDADAFVGHGFEQFEDDHFRTREPVRLDVCHAHAAREVEGDEHVAAERFLGACPGIRLRAGQSEDHGGAGGQQEKQGEPAGQGTAALEQRATQAGGDKGRPLLAPHARHGHRRRSQQREQHQQDEPGGLGELHRRSG